MGGTCSEITADGVPRPSTGTLVSYGVVLLGTALLALKARRPVKIVYDRAEETAATTKRHPAIVRHRQKIESAVTNARAVLAVRGGRNPYDRASPRRP